MTVKEIKESYGTCGLVCALCSSYQSTCPGCKCEKEKCEITKCCDSKDISYCFECGEWPCGRDMHKGIRTKAFNSVAKNEGLDRLSEYLYTNWKYGISYHRADKLPGDYDRCKTVDEVISLLKNGKPDPYDLCPTYESKSFLLRLISVDDAKDLLECYKNPTLDVKANDEGCGYGYGAQTIEEMKEFISRWLEEYKDRSFTRFTILDKKTGKAAGTVEIFGSGLKGHSVLRIDLFSEYEQAEYVDELLKISDSFFHDFSCAKIVTKEGTRGAVLSGNGYAPYPANQVWERDNCYIKIKS